MAHPWSAAADPLPEKPAGVDFGWVDGDGWHRGTRASLEARCRTGDAPLAVWTPDAPRLQMPGEVEWLRAPLTEAAGASSTRWRARLGFAFAGAAAIGAWYFGAGGTELLWLGVAGIAIAALLWITAATRARQTARSLSPEEIAAARAEVEHARWLGAQRVTYTNYLVYVIAACGLCQLLVGMDRSIAAAGLVPWDVRAGEVWRIATAPLLHGNVLHFFLNYGALVAFARLLEVHAHRAYVPLVFAVTAVGGNIASLVLPPEVPAIGASGGILGLLGALLALGTIRRRHLPARFTRSLWAMVGATALLGLIGFAFIDNAAHLGGLVSGGLLGLLFLAHRDTPSVAPGRAMVRAGDASLALIALSGVWAIVKMLGVV